MAWVDPKTAIIVAHLDEVRAVVAKQADEIGARAQALFAPHDRPGGHEIQVTHEKVDSLVELVGPVPWVLEWGRGPNENGRDAMEGLHILGRAAGI